MPTTAPTSVSAPLPHRRRNEVSQPLQPTAMREVNLGALMRAVRRLGPRARVELAAQTGISPATVTKLVASLTDVHILRELADLRTERSTGRPRVPVDFDNASRCVLALHVGITSCLAATVDLRGRILTRTEFPHSGESAEDILIHAAAKLAEMRDSLDSHSQVVGIGVGSGGAVDYRAGVLRSHPALGWQEVPVRRILLDSLGLPCEYDETVRGVALFEQQHAGWDGETILHIFVGTGVQCALVIDGHLHRGFESRAGSLDHWPVPGVRGPECSCGQTNCFGRLASNAGVAWLARDRGYLPAEAGYDDLILAAEGGHRGIRQLLRQRARWIGRMVAAAADLIDPSVVLISGSAPRWSGFTSEMAAALEQSGSPVEAGQVRYTAEPFDLVAAAAALFLDVYFDDPVRYEPGLQRRFVD